MKRNFNLSDLVFLLIFIGFSFFTTFSPIDDVSIAYRAFVVMIGLLCIFRNRNQHIALGKPLKLLFTIMVLMTIKVVYHLYLGELALKPVDHSRNMTMLFAFGVVWVPIIALIRGSKSLDREVLCYILLIALLMMITKGLMTAMDANVEGRFELNKRQSTLAFGDKGAMLAIISASFIAMISTVRSNWRKIILILSIGGLIIGIMGVLKAGSRGPMISGITAVAFVFTVMRFRTKIYIVLATCLSFVFGIVSVNMIYSFAPVIFARMNNTIEDHDTSGRDVLFEEALDKMSNNPILGDNPFAMEPGGYDTYHNVYLDVGATLGLICFTLFVGLTIYLLIKTISTAHQHKSVFSLFILAMFWFFAVRGLTGVFLLSNDSYVATYALTCLLMNKTARKKREVYLQTRTEDQPLYSNY